MDINQTDLQMWCCFDLHLADRSHQSSHLSLTQVISDILALSQQQYDMVDKVVVAAPAPGWRGTSLLSIDNLVLAELSKEKKEAAS